MLSNYSAEEKARLQAFQISRFQRVLERHRAVLWGSELELLDLALFSLYRSCVAAGAREAADELLARHRPRTGMEEFSAN